MVNTVEKVSGNKVKLSFTVPAAEMDAAIEKAYRKNRGKIQVPGFRPGKAPRAVIERMYGKGIFFEDAFEEVFSAEYFKAVSENELEVVDQPSLTDLPQYKPGEDYSFGCEVFVTPEVTLGDYKGLEVTRTIRKVTDAEIDAELEAERKKVARVEDVEDRPLQEGDDANIDYLGTVDGVPFDGGKAEGYSLRIGSNTFISGFEPQLVGMNIGEEKDINVTFPEEYHAEELKGKPAVFHVKLNGIQAEELPALDDDFAAEVSEFDTLNEYKKSISDKLQQRYDDAAKAQVEAEVIRKAAENAQMDIPAPMVDEEVTRRLEMMDYSLKNSGLNLETYMKWTGMTIDKLREQYRGEAEKEVRQNLTLEAVGKAESVEPTDEEIEAEYARIAGELKEDVEALKARLDASQKQFVREQVIRTKVKDLLVSSAVVTDKEEETAESAKEQE